MRLGPRAHTGRVRELRCFRRALAREAPSQIVWKGEPHPTPERYPVQPKSAILATVFYTRES
jgi:hypothetical protein